jgi:hypothetical protein
MSEESVRVDVRTYYKYSQTLLLREKEEKVKNVRGDFFFFYSPIPTTVSDVYNASRPDNSASVPFR